MHVNPWHLRQAARTVREGGLIAYPTEAVYGLGCDPANAGAVRALLALKDRPASAGLILIAAELAQLERWVAPLEPAVRARVEATWPGPVTWLLPAGGTVPAEVRGAHDTLAARVTAHPIAAALCRAAATPLVSTSANRRGGAPARTALAVRRLFGDALDYVVPGPVGGLDRPTEIRDARTGEVVRPG